MIACIEDPVVIEKILTHLNEKALPIAASLLPESRAPPQAGWFDTNAVLSDLEADVPKSRLECLLRVVSGHSMSDTVDKFEPGLSQLNTTYMVVYTGPNPLTGHGGRGIPRSWL